MTNNTKKNKKKVAFVLTIPPPFGGGEIVSLELFHKLENLYYFILIKQKNHSKSKQGNIDISSYLRGIKYLFKVLYGIITIRPTILYIGVPKDFSTFFRNSIAIVFAKLLRIRVYGEIHGMSFLFLNNKFKYRYYKFIINKIDKIRVLGFSIKEYLHNTGYKNKIYVINNGISGPTNISENKRNIINDKLKFIYIGGISENKGFFKVIELLSMLEKSNIYNWELNVIGEWVHVSEKSNAFNLIEAADLSNKIHFRGKLVNGEKWDAISNNNILLHFTKFDGQPLTIIEAMCLGIPTISTKIGGIPEMIANGNNGFLIDDIEEAIEIIKSIFSGRADFNAVSFECKKTFQKNYNADKMAQDIINMVND